MHLNDLFHQKLCPFEKIIPGSGLQISQHMPAGILTRCFTYVTNPNQAQRLVARVFFVEQNRPGIFGQHSPSISKLTIFSAKIKAKRIPIAYYTPTYEHLSRAVSLTF